MTSVLTRREYAYVSISGPGTHEAVTAALQLRPSEAWNAGDKNPRNGKPRRGMVWRLSSDLDGTRESELRKLWVDYELTLQCVGYYPSWTHGVHFDRDVVRHAAGLGFAIDLDCYFVEERDDDAREGSDAART